MNDVPEGAHPFTTIDPSVGEAYVRVDCAPPAFDETCTPSVGYCDDGTRFVPTQLVDVTGLIPGAHEGKGLGNQFLSDLNEAGRVDYTPGDDDFEVVGDLSEERTAGLEQIRSLLGEHGGTGVQSALEAALFDALDLIAVFPGSDDGGLREPHPHGSGRRVAPRRGLPVVATDRERPRTRRPGRGRTGGDELAAIEAVCRSARSAACARLSTFNRYYHARRGRLRASGAPSARSRL